MKFERVLTFCWFSGYDVELVLLLFSEEMSILFIFDAVFDDEIFSLVMSERFEAVLWLLRIENLFLSFLNDGSYLKKKKIINSDELK